MIGLSILIIICIFLVIINKLWGTAIRNVPGPKLAFPILGHLPYLDALPAKTFLEWKKIYGPIFSVKMGSMNAVILNDINLIREAYACPEVQARPPQPVFQAACKNKGMVFASGPSVFEQRKFVLKSFKRFCFDDRGNYETITHDEIGMFFKKLDANLNKCLFMEHEFNTPALNVIWTLFMGERFDHDDHRAKYLVKCSDIFMTMDGVLANLAFFVPLVAKLFPEMSGFKRQEKAGVDLYEFIENKFKEECPNRIKGLPKNYREAWMDKSEKADPDSSFHPSHNNFPATMGDLLLGSIETTGTTIDWGIIHLARNPECQARLQEELDRVVGSDGVVMLADRPNLPYLEATLHEVFRISSLGPFGLLHYVTDNWHFQGYHIPRDTMLIGNLYSVHHNPEVWTEPGEFRPQRFLESDGNNFNLINTNLIIPFSAGKRVCLGETAARDITFLFLGNIFHKYNVNCLPNEIPDIEPIAGVTLTPKPYKMMFSSRRK